MNGKNRHPSDLNEYEAALENINSDEDFSVPDTDTRWFTHDIYDLKEMRVKIINPLDVEK